MKKALFICLFLVVFLHVKAQTVAPELVSTAGDSFSNTNYQLDWSIGESITATHSNGTNVLTQGFHQNTYEVLLLVDDFQTAIDISVYPNPTTNFININVGDAAFQQMQYTITDYVGKTIKKANLNTDTEQISFANYANGTYFLTVKRNNKLLKNFKIIKK